MVFEVHRAGRADLLAEGLAQLLRDPLPDPFARELVIVPARGVERWLSQRLSHRLGPSEGGDDGVCAGVDFRSPASLVAEILGTRDEDPWHPDALSWTLLRVVDASLDEPWAAVLAEHLGHGLDDEEGRLRQGRRYAVARRLAGLFASYAVHRPALLEDWETGGAGDGGGGRLPDDLAWQPHLWRRLVEAVGHPSPVVRHAQVVAALRAGTQRVAVPSRVSLFGHTRLSRTEADLLAALGQSHDVHLWLPHPSDALWAQLRGSTPATWRRDDRSHVDVEHPLLAAMARDVRETEGILLRAGATDSAVAPDPDRAPSLLGRVQSEIAADRVPTARSGEPDASIQVHACHGPARQVEVLREVLLGLLDDDPTLEPRDVLVMCPDIDAYAPLITGAFGLGDAVAGSHPGHQLRVMLADRSPTQTNPLLGVLAKLLDLADGRAEATRVLDLLATDAVRRRFAFTEKDLETITNWVVRTGVRWAWDESGRERFGLAAYKQNTWRFGLDRVLAGVALSDDSGLWLGPTLPLDDVSTTDIAVAGRLAEAVDRLQALTCQLTGTHAVEHWLELLRDGVDQLTDVAPGDDWQRAQMHRELAGLATAASSGTRLDLRLHDVQALLRTRLAGRPTRANFRTGTLTVCTMTPMRSVPHRVICLLGLDDGVFPRGGAIDGDDVLARLPMVGEPDVRSQDRQLFLDAIMSAGEHLVITYTGFSETSGQERPPSVPLREFLDVAEQTAGHGVVVEHRAQAFHTDYLTPGGLGRAGARFSFDPDAARAARAAASPNRTARPSLSALDVGPAPREDVDLADLVDVLTSPVTGFLRRRLGIDLPREEDEIADSMPVAPSGLELWQVGDRMLQEIIRGRAVEDALQAEWRRGMLPPGRLGWRLAQQVAACVGPLAEMFETSTQGIDAQARDLSIDLGDGRRLTGAVTGLYGNRLVRVGYSRLKAKQRLEAWISLVALSAGHPGAWVSRAIGRAAEGDAPVRATYAEVPEPLAILRDLVDLHDLALSRVLPMAADCSRLYAKNVSSSRPEWAVDKENAQQWRKDNRGADLATAWGHAPSWAEITQEQGSPGHPHLFGELATRLWGPILTAEVE